VINLALSSMNASLTDVGSPNLLHLHAAAGLSERAVPTERPVALPLPQGGALRGTWFEPATAARAVA